MSRGSSTHQRCSRSLLSARPAVVEGTEPPRHVRRLLGKVGVMSGNTSRRYPPELRERAVRMVAEIRAQHESEWAAMRAVVGVARCRNHRNGAQLGSPGRYRRRRASGSVDRGVRGGPPAEAGGRRTQTRQRYLGSVLSFGSLTRLFSSWTVSSTGVPPIRVPRSSPCSSATLVRAVDGFHRPVHGCGRARVSTVPAATRLSCAGFGRLPAGLSGVTVIQFADPFA